MIDWNAVGAIGQWAGAIVTFAGVGVALWLAHRADAMSRQTSRMFLQQTRIMSAGLRLIAMTGAGAKGQFNYDMVTQAMRELETMVAEAEKLNSPGGGTGG